jgi:hypothetical protein
LAGIFEGAVQGVVGKLRAAFAADKDHISRDLAKGSTSPVYPDRAFDLFQAFGYDALSNYLRIEQDLMSRYVDYENMMELPEVYAALTIYADDATQTDSQLKRTVWATSPDKTLQTNLDDLYNRTLRLDEEINEIAKSLVCYGNDYEEILVNENGVVGLNYLPAPTVRRVEGPRGELYGFIQDWKARFGVSPHEFQQVLAARNAAMAGMSTKGSASVVGNSPNPLVTALEPWEVCHFRLRGKTRRSAYGVSVLDGARWIFKRLIMLEDAAMIYRLQRAPERFAFYVDIGDLPPQEALAYVNKVRQMYKKKRIINSAGKLDLKYSPLAADSDFYVPTRKGTDGARIETLGAPAWQHMDDVAYFQNKLFTALSVPKAYLAHEEGAHRNSLCLVGGTKIPLLDGRTLTMREIVDEFGSDREFHVYSCDDEGRVSVGVAKGARVTRPNAEVWEVELDDGSTIRGTPDHPFMMRDGSYRNLEDLVSGDSLMPLYRKEASGKQRSERLPGYEMVQHPANSRWEYTHRVVSRWKWGEYWWKGTDGKSLVCHHSAFNKLNNDPTQLCLMERAEHIRFHAEHAAVLLQRADVVEKRMRGVKKWANTDRCKDLLKLHAEEARRDPNSKQRRWARSEQHRELKAEQMKGQWEAPDSKLRRRTKTKAYSEASRRIARDMWAREGYRESHSGDNYCSWRADASIEHLINSAKSLRCKNQAQLQDRSGYSSSLIYRLLAGAGLTYEQFAQSYIEGGYKPRKRNHKVVAVRFIGREDCYDFTVKDFHNFAVAAGGNSGIFVHNSSQDVRFSRSVLRVQRELRNGLKRIGRTHLAALNINSEKAQFEVNMTIPSAIFELAQLEVRNARADLAARMREHVSLRWVLENVYQLADEDIAVVIKERQEDALRDGKVQAEVEKMSAQAQAAIARPEGVETIKRIPRLTELRGARGISMKEFEAGNRESEKRAAAKLDLLLRRDDYQTQRIKELGALLHELTSAVRCSSGRRTA